MSNLRFICVFAVVLGYVALSSCTITLDYLNCGVDKETEVTVNEVEINRYPWVGVLYYFYTSDGSEVRSVTTVVLIQKEFVLAAAADIGPMPKHNFRRNSRVLLGESWLAGGRRVRNYVLHPEYGETYNSLALVQLVDIVRDVNIRPVCPTPSILRDPVFYVIRFNEDYTELKKEVWPMAHVPGQLCKEFYIAANLYNVRMRPPHAACAVSLDTSAPCVWPAGAALVSRDHWGRWTLLGLGVRGPGCGAPSRYLDMAHYYPWVSSALSKFGQITITKLTKQKYALRSGARAMQKFGACDSEEKGRIVFREYMILRTNHMQYQFLNYNLTMYETIEYTCLTLELLNATASSEIRILHICPVRDGGRPCYKFKGSTVDLSLNIMFSDTCAFQMIAWGEFVNMTVIDIQTWKWEEGSHYEDFNVWRVPYRGPSYMTEYGFNPDIDAFWTPQYSIWTTTTQPTTPTTTTTTPTTTTTTTPTTPVHTRGYWRTRTRTTTTTTTTKPVKTKKTKKTKKPAKKPG